MFSGGQQAIAQSFIPIKLFSPVNIARPKLKKAEFTENKPCSAASSGVTHIANMKSSAHTILPTVSMQFIDDWVSALRGCARMLRWKRSLSGQVWWQIKTNSIHV